ncbi:hypothetical protein FRB91_004703 [Serendipita sp. 411]|nr:hypothetical protein FRB91_004703 [Serendipita sp. 411]
MLNGERLCLGANYVSVERFTVGSGAWQYQGYVRIMAVSIVVIQHELVHTVNHINGTAKRRVGPRESAIVKISEVELHLVGLVHWYPSVTLLSPSSKVSDTRGSPRSYTRTDYSIVKLTSIYFDEKSSSYLRIPFALESEFMPTYVANT